MKYKMIAFFLVLTLMSWAQTATQNNPTPAPEQKGDQAKASCPCCDATAQTKDQHAGCMRNASSKDGGGKMACCSDKGTTCCGRMASPAREATKLRRPAAPSATSVIRPAAPWGNTPRRQP